MRRECASDKLEYNNSSANSAGSAGEGYLCSNDLQEKISR
jgi:hypothetical protein